MASAAPAVEIIKRITENDPELVTADLAGLLVGNEVGWPSLSLLISRACVRLASPAYEV
jgi:hypothetical protein